MTEKQQSFIQDLMIGWRNEIAQARRYADHDHVDAQKRRENTLAKADMLETVINAIEMAITENRVSNASRLIDVLKSSMSSALMHARQGRWNFGCDIQVDLDPDLVISFRRAGLNVPPNFK